jgi:hypothetical protein
MSLHTKTFIVCRFSDIEVLMVLQGWSKPVFPTMAPLVQDDLKPQNDCSFFLQCLPRYVRCDRCGLKRKDLTTLESEIKIDKYALLLYI